MTEYVGHLAEVKDLSVDFHTRYGTVHAVRNVSWHLDRGECFAILGESGSGKSVTAAAFMGLIDSPPGYITGGGAFFRGQNLLELSEEERCEINGKKIAMIFQDTLAALNPVYPIGWQVAETFRAHGVSPREAREKALDLLDRVGIPDPRRRVNDYPHQFSGGQRQRIMIAMAIGLKPDLLIADEPTTALDVTVQAQILRLVKELQEETGMGLLLITHDMGVVAEVADRIAVMKDGRIVETGPVRHVFKEPAHPYTRKLIDAVPGLHPFDQKQKDDGAGVEVLISARDVSKHYEIKKGLFRRHTEEVVRAVDSVSFELRRGETLGIVGESGSGKSTLARTLLGLEEPTGGTATYRGQSMFGLSEADQLALRRRIQVVFQDPTASLNPRMTIEEIISEPWVIHPGVVPKDQWHARVVELLEQVGLNEALCRRYPHQFSGGQQQRVAIARALALRPELIICDEAVSALDVSVQAQVIALLKDLKREFGLSYMFIAHDLGVVRDFADRVLVMYRGKIVEQGDTEQIFDRPQHPYTQELIAAVPSPDPDARPIRSRKGRGAARRAATGNQTMNEPTISLI